MTQHLVPPATVIRCACDALVRAGAPADRAAVQAAHLVEADLRGHASHGVQRLRVLVDRMANGVLVPGGPITIRREVPAFLAVDGGDGFGPVVAYRVLAAAAATAAATGVAVAAVRRCGHLGILAPYAEWSATRRLIAVITTTSEPLVHPWGGSEALVGTNPLSIGVPGEPDGLTLDMATSLVPMGRIIHHERRGVPLEPGWALDQSGRPTTDPTAARAGALTPFGGPKGAGLGVALEVLVGGLSSTALGRAVTGTLDPSEPCTKGDLFVVIDPERCGVAGLSERVGAYLDEVRRSRPIDAGLAVTIPGERARARRGRSLEEGITLTEETLRELEELSGHHVETTRVVA